MRQTVAVVFLLAFALIAMPVQAGDQAAIKQHVDEMVTAINNGKAATSYAPDAYEPYAFIMTAEGMLLVHPYLAGESLPEKAAPIYQALQQATEAGLWVEYLWKGVHKRTYVRKTANQLIIGSGN